MTLPRGKYSGHDLTDWLLHVLWKVAQTFYTGGLGMALRESYVVVSTTSVHFKHYRVN